MVRKPRVGLIRVLTVEDPVELGVHGRIIERQYPGLELHSHCIPDQFEGIYDDRTQRIAEPKIVRLAERLAPEVDAIVITCCADPAVASLRQTLRIPVIGAGSAVATAARAYTDRICVLGLTGEPPDVIARILGSSMVAYLVPSGVRIAPDLVTAEGRQSVLDTVARARELGVGAIALACGAMATSGVAPLIAKEYGIPTIDPVVACGLFASHALLTMRSGE